MEKDNEVISLKKIIIYYLDHWKLFVGAGTISLVLAVLYLVLYPKTYEIMSVVKIQDEKDLTSGGGISMGDAAGLMRSFGLGGGAAGSINIDDEISTLKSNSLLSKTVVSLGLDVTYEKPFSFRTLYDDSPVIVKPDSTFRANLDRTFKFQLKIDQAGVAVDVDDSGEKLTFSGLPVVWQTENGVLTICYRDSIHKDLPVKLNVSIMPVSWVAEDLSESLSIEEYSKTSNTIELLYEDHNKLRGKDLLNTLLAQYNKQASLVKQKDGNKSQKFLDQRIDGVVVQLKDIERLIEVYKLKNKMTDVEYDVMFYTEAIKTYREKLIELEAQKYMVNLVEEYVKDPQNKYKLVPAAISSGAGESDKSSPVALYNQALVLREKTLMSSKGENPIAEVEEKQIEKLRESVIVSVENASKSLDVVMSDLKSQEKAIFDKMGNVPTYEREYLDMKRQQEILQGVYLVLLQKREEIALSAEGGRDKGFITDAAFVKHKPVAPRKLFAAIFVVFFTFGIPMGYLFIINRLKELLDELKRQKSCK